MRLSRKVAVALVVGGLVLGGSLSSLASSPGSPREFDMPGTFETPVVAPAPRPAKVGGFIGGAIVRSTGILQNEDGDFVTAETDAGELKAIDGDLLTISEADGRTVEITTDGATRFGRDSEKASREDLEIGDHVIAHRIDGATKHVMAISAERRAEMEQRRDACRDANQATECEPPAFGRGKVVRSRRSA